MILSNYWKYMMAVCNHWYEVGNGNYNIETNCINTAGSSTPVSIKGGSAGEDTRWGADHAIRANLEVCIGDGTTEPTVEDYALGHDITSNITNYDSSIVFSADNGYKTIITASGINNTSSEITITEVGVYKKTLSTVDPSAWSNDKIMFAKIILDNPITVAAHGSFSLVCEWVEA